jgi:hypothetical protein
MAFRRTLWLGPVVFALAAASAGCSDPYPGLNEVSGTVTLQGQPLKSGTISFVPLDNQGSQSGTTIENGAYLIPRKAGLKAGKYLVQITSGDGQTPANEETAGAPGGSTNIVSVDLIPEDWNTKSKQQVEVKAGANKHDFAIPNANPRARRR